MNNPNNCHFCNAILTQRLYCFNCKKLHNLEYVLTYHVYGGSNFTKIACAIYPVDRISYFYSDLIKNINYFVFNSPNKIQIFELVRPSNAIKKYKLYTSFK